MILQLFFLTFTPQPPMQLGIAFGGGVGGGGNQKF